MANGKKHHDGPHLKIRSAASGSISLSNGFAIAHWELSKYVICLYVHSDRPRMLMSCPEQRYRTGSPAQLYAPQSSQPSYRIQCRTFPRRYPANPRFGDVSMMRRSLHELIV
jgi:hypothetical protein